MACQVLDPLYIYYQFLYGHVSYFNLVIEPNFQDPMSVWLISYLGLVYARFGIRDVGGLTLEHSCLGMGVGQVVLILNTIKILKTTGFSIPLPSLLMSHDSDMTQKRKKGKRKYDSFY